LELKKDVGMSGVTARVHQPFCPQTNCAKTKLVPIGVWSIMHIRFKFDGKFKFTIFENPPDYSGSGAFS
jgi:hypothetical protein